MKSIILKKKLLRRGIYLIIILLIVYTGIYLTVPQLLKSNGISISKFSYDFPSTLTLEGTSINVSPLHGEIGTILIDWSWLELLHGNVQGDYLIIENANIVHSFKSQFNSDTSSFKLPKIRFEDIIIKETNIVIENNIDTTQLNIPLLKITGFDLSENLAIDSIINNESEVHIISSSQSGISDDSTSGFEFNSLPQVSINYLQFTNCYFNYTKDKDGEQKIRNFNIQAHQLESKNVFDCSIEELSFVYQDTLAINVALGDNEQDESGEILLTDLSVNLPGLDLTIPKLKINNQDTFSMEMIIDHSMIHSSYLWLLISKDYFPLSGDIPVYIDGKISYQNSQLSFNQFALGLSDKANLKGSAKFGLNGANSLFSTDQLILNSTLYNLSSLFGLEIPKGQKELDIHSIINIKGTYDHFVVDCQNVLNTTNIHLYTELDYRQAKSTGILLSLKSDHIYPSNLISSLPTGLELSGLDFVASSIFNEKNRPVQLKGVIKSDSIRFKDFWAVNPEIELKSDQVNSSLTIGTSTNETEILLEIKGNIFESDNLNYNGLISTKTPSLNNPGMTTGLLYTNFHGSHQFNSDSFCVDIDLDSMYFSPFDVDTFFTSSGRIHFQKDSVGTMNVNAHLDSLNIIECTFNSDLFTWIQNDKKFGNYPQASIDLRLQVDSILMTCLSGESIYLDLPSLVIETNGDFLSSDLSIKDLSIKDYHMEDLYADLNSTNHQFNGNLNISSIGNSFLEFDSIEAVIKTNQDSTVSFFLSSHIPAVKNYVTFGTSIRYLDDGILLNLDEKHGLHFGEQIWQIMDNRGIFIDKDFKTKYAYLQISNKEQNITLNSLSDQINLIIDSLQLQPLAQLFYENKPLEGILNIETEWLPQNNDFNWTASIYNIVFDTLDLGVLRTDGTIKDDQLSAKASLESELTTVNLAVLREDIPIEFDLKINDFDLDILNELIPINQDSILLGGIIDASLRGSYNETLQANGILSFQNALLHIPNYGFYTEIASDTVYFNDNNIKFRDLEINDIYQNKLAVNGNIELKSDPKISLNIKSNHFTLLDQENENENVWGKVNFSTDLNIQGELFTQLNVSGQFNPLPIANLNYKYKSSVSLDEREQVITFKSFDKKSEKLKTTKTKSSLPIIWNVDMDIGQTDLFVLINESTRDYARLTADGKLRMRSGTDGQPQLFGEVVSNDGSIFYDAPMVSDLNLKIISATAEWNGDPEKPLISFRGSEVFRVSPSEFPGQLGNKNSRVPVSVHAIIDKSSIETFNIRFDLSSNNGQIGNYLEGLPAEAREQYAINLLVFGKVGSNFESGGSSFMEGVVAKLNEISRRNIKKADLSFYVDSELSEENSTETVNKLGYSFSKGFFKKKVRFSIGGDINLSDNAPQGSKKINPLGNIRLDYILSENPDITLNAIRSDVYKGAIEGQVNESSLGITYQKRFRNFFRIFRKKEAR